MTWRQELKYIVSGADRELLLGRLCTALTPDPYAVRNGFYQIRTLYFDDPFDSSLFNTLAGVPEREKYRLRMYNSDQGFLRLEKKIKRYGGSQKPEALLTAEECNRLLHKDYMFLGEKNDPFLQNAYAAAISGGLNPRCVVDYTRAAFCHPAGNVRVTIDSEIHANRNTDVFFKEPFAGVPVLENGACVLEVKYDSVLPDFIRDIIRIGDRSRVSLSKYAAGCVID